MKIEINDIGDFCEQERFFVAQEVDGTFKELKILCALKDGTIFENQRWCDSTPAECLWLRAYLDVLARKHENPNI